MRTLAVTTMREQGRRNCYLAANDAMLVLAVMIILIVLRCAVCVGVFRRSLGESGLDWSDTNLFFDGASGQFYDPSRDKWCNSDKNIWYKLLRELDVS